MSIRRHERGGLAADLAAANETPMSREIYVEYDTGQAKVGDGSTAYNSLPYIGDGMGATGGTLEPATLTADTDNFDCTGHDIVIFDNSSGGDLAITGLVSESGVKQLINRGTSRITLPGEDAGSSAANRFAWSSSIPAAGYVFAYHSGTRWEVYS